MENKNKRTILDISKQYLSKDKLRYKVWGSLLQRWKLGGVLLGVLIFPLFISIVSPVYNSKVDDNRKVEQEKADSVEFKVPCFLIQLNDTSNQYTIELKGTSTKASANIESSDIGMTIYNNPFYQIFCLVIFLTLAMAICLTLRNIYILTKKETYITWCHIVILLLLGLGIIGLLLIIDVKENPRIAAVLGIAGSILTWIFQDTVKGVAVYFHLRFNKLLNIDDWIIIPKYDIDGEVSRVTLTTVTVYNWDTTTSSVPISVLHSEHFQNLKKMMDGKTFGRKMSKTFIFDTSWFNHLTSDEVALLKSKVPDVTEYLTDEQLQNPKSTNARLFRLYIYHWLMNHPHISQQPRLIVRWLDQKDSGMPLEIYAFIIDSSLPAFEWQQSKIIEHVLDTIQWFGLRLYQNASAYDVSNSNIYLTDKPATYRKED